MTVPSPTPLDMRGEPPECRGHFDPITRTVPGADAIPTVGDVADRPVTAGAADGDAVPGERLTRPAQQAGGPEAAVRARSRPVARRQSWHRAFWARLTALGGERSEPSASSAGSVRRGRDGEQRSQGREQLDRLFRSGLHHLR